MIRLCQAFGIRVEEPLGRWSPGSNPAVGHFPDRSLILGFGGRAGRYHPGALVRPTRPFPPVSQRAGVACSPGPRVTGPHPGHGHRGPGGADVPREQRSGNPAPSRHPGRRMRPDEPPDPPLGPIARHGERSPPIPDSDVAVEDGHRARRRAIDRPPPTALPGFRFQGWRPFHRPQGGLASDRGLRDVRLG